MEDQEVITLIAKYTVGLIDEIQAKLKILNNSHNGMNYLVLTELYSLRTRTYILAHESHFFQLDQQISKAVVTSSFQIFKAKITTMEDLLSLKKTVFLISMLISSIGVGEIETTLEILSKLESL